MKAITKLYIKTFLLTAIPYFSLMTLFGFDEISKTIILKNITASLFFGIFMSLILVSFHWYKLKKDGVKNITDENIGVNQTKKIETKLNKEQLIQKLKLDPTIRKMKMTEIENGVLLKTGMTMKSWGEEIKIILKSNKENNFEYQLSSSPKLKTTIVDYGKNLENINKIESVIKNIA
ncbi:hypothetical protein [Flavobacterium sp.]|jgi:TM2 domain-containing membrane protein YozV|uniref:hypothetical protein n=1 Tax=Flavobacterium sp. TaxID=239 RepID=UPI0037C1B3E3